MESVETWMWIIAGILIGSLVFVGGYKMLVKYVEHTEISTVQDSFNKMSTMMKSVCSGGSYNREVKSLAFPFSVSKIYVRDEDGLENYGRELCYDFTEKENCVVPSTCFVTMNTINLQQKTGIFYNVQKFLGKKDVARIRITVTKEKAGELTAVWTQEVNE
ncbi:hypothetical protein JXA85_06615 [Candidatus Woesearchaeota archaeon]|nr:hypothetical protein [Candidatus Woesearchaeota archaeon]